MRIQLLVALSLAGCVIQAKEPRFYEKGTLAEMNAVGCGYEEKGAKSAAGVLLGTGDEHRKTHEMLCQEYVLRSQSMVYRIRPKEEKRPFILPVGDHVEFRILKDRMYVRVPELDDHERQFFVTSIVQRTDVTADQSARASKIPDKPAEK
jgi:hypothetical protein